MNSDPAKVLLEFVGAEFDGNPAFRVDNVLYSAAKKKAIVKKHEPMVGEIFVWDNAELCIVESFRVLDKKIDRTTAKFFVDFIEIGCTEKKGYGEVPLVIDRKNKVVAYNLQYMNNKWWIYNPPIPRVSRKALLRYNNEIIGQMDSFVNNNGTEVQKRYYRRLLDANKVLNDTGDKRE